MVVAQGTAQDLMDNPASVTGRYLKKPLPHPLQARRPINNDTGMIRVEGAHLHNLRNVTASLPIGRLSVVTGVSGSGKSTLARAALQVGRASCWERACPYVSISVVAVSLKK